MKRILLFLVLLLAVRTIPGCRTSGPAESSMFAALVRKSTGMVGVVPPREDVRAGDVFVYGEDPEAGDRPKPITATPLWSSLPVREEVEAHYGGRPSFPATPSEYLSGVDEHDELWPEPQNPEAFHADGEAEMNRLRTVSLPAVTFTKSVMIGSATLGCTSTVVRPNPALRSR